MDRPNPIKVFLGVVDVLRRHDPPNPHGSDAFHATALKRPLAALREGGIGALADATDDLDEFMAAASAVQPDLLSPGQAVAYWINLYNAGAMQLAVEAFGEGATSVLRIPGAFGRPLVSVAGESLSLDAIEHAKLRRLGDPRIHGALVCGSLSCPTLRATPYGTDDVDFELDDQMRAFLSGGGAVVEDGILHLSRIFSWFGRDFVSPSKMPTFIPAPRRAVVKALRPWLTGEALDTPRVVFQPYDWALACSIA